MSITYIAGLDLGQAVDYTALAILEQTRNGQEPATYTCRHLERWPLGTSYTQIVADVARLTGQAPIAGGTLVIDGTGCGRPVVDLFRAGEQAGVVPVMITAGHQVSRALDGYLHVPKRDLVGAMLALANARRFKFARGLRLAKVAEKELSTFTVKITASANEQFSSDWREGQHDDICLALLLAAWVGEHWHTGPFEVGNAEDNRTLISRVPAGVFLPEGERPW
jgi:hypothetical protein